jgi:glucans biosynthesis protein C
VWPSLSRKGVRSFLAGRAYRIGVPFILGTAILMPAAHYPVYRLTATDPSVSAFWAHWIALPYWPNGPLWFLWQLFLLNLAAAALFLLWPGFARFAERALANARDFPGRVILVFGGFTILAYLPLASIFKPWEWSQIGPFSVQSAQALLFPTYFFAGIAVGANGFERGLLDADGALARGWRRWLGMAGAAFVAWLCVTALTYENKTLPGLETLSALLYAISSATACPAIIALFLRFATARVPAAESLAGNAYGIYLVHYFPVIWLQYLLLAAPLWGFAKGMSVAAASLALSWAVAAASARILSPARPRVASAGHPGEAAVAEKP